MANVKDRPFQSLWTVYLLRLIHSVTLLHSAINDLNLDSVKDRPFQSLERCYLLVTLFTQAINDWMASVKDRPFQSLERVYLLTLSIRHSFTQAINDWMANVKDRPFQSLERSIFYTVSMQLRLNAWCVLYSICMANWQRRRANRKFRWETPKLFHCILANMQFWCGCQILRKFSVSVTKIWQKE